jgi:hypothetical protein
MAVSVSNGTEGTTSHKLSKNEPPGRVMNWFYDIGTGHGGPVDDETLQAMWEEGALPPNATVCAEGADVWQPVHEVLNRTATRDTGMAAAPDGESSTAAMEALLAPQKRIVTLLWFGFTGSLFMYLGVVFILAKQAGETAPVDEKLVSAMTVAAVVAGMVGLLYRRAVFGEARLRAKLTHTIDPTKFTVLHAESPQGIARTQRYRALSVGDQKIYLLIQSLFKQRIICLAFFEAVSIFGVVLGFMSKDASMTVPFVVASVGLNALVFPRIDALRERAQRWT